jgi:hypothetical protein
MSDLTFFPPDFDARFIAEYSKDNFFFNTFNIQLLTITPRMPDQCNISPITAANQDSLLSCFLSFDNV